MAGLDVDRRPAPLETPVRTIRVARDYGRARTAAIGRAAITCVGPCANGHPSCALTECLHKDMSGCCDAPRVMGLAARQVPPTSSKQFNELCLPRLSRWREDADAAGRAEVYLIVGTYCDP